MKIIHVAGWSGSGKTTFIRDLIGGLRLLGKVGSVKHIGDHVCDLPAGKDTTLHYESGATLTVGIDLEKTIITSRSVSLAGSLDILADNAVRYAVVEGFKAASFTKVVTGDLDAPALLRDPTVDEVLACLDRFDDYDTLAGLIRETENGHGDDILHTLTGYADPDIRPVCAWLEAEISTWTGISDVRVRYNGPVLDRQGRFFVVIRSVEPGTGIRALAWCGEVLDGKNRQIRIRDGVRS
jgi:molybdopterin-guanine dinucleotide biosynthesis protein MobB